MLFNSFVFLIFFAVVTSFYFIIPHKIRWLFLLIASCFFYMCFIPVYILILASTIVIDYFSGILIENAGTVKRRKTFLILSLVTNIGVLVFFKYCNFFIDNLNGIASLIHWNYSIQSLEIILPIGLSFHTFQAMSYTIEVYRDKQKAERHFGIYALYVMYYPQLVAGPIERPQNLLPQFHAKHVFEYNRVSSGLKQMLWGFFKKIVIADRLAYFVNLVYDHPHDYQGISIFLATIFFSFQIFCDFSGYTDIAIGASRIMGIDLMANFRSPYFSRSISEFWGRWHISLSSWFRDYLYIPLGGNRVKPMRWIFNLLLVFIISGFWHGAKWTFIIWGGLHGIYLVLEIFWRNLRKRFPVWMKWNQSNVFVKLLQIGFVFVLVSFAWIFFRAKDISTAGYIAMHFITGIPQYLSNLGRPHFLWLEPIIFNKYYKDYWMEFVMIVFSVSLMEWVHWVELKQNLVQFMNNKKVVWRWSFYMGIIYLILLFGIFHSNTEFIYFQF